MNSWLDPFPAGIGQKFKVALYSRFKLGKTNGHSFEYHEEPGWCDKQLRRLGSLVAYGKRSFPQVGLDLDHSVFTLKSIFSAAAPRLTQASSGVAMVSPQKCAHEPLPVCGALTREATVPVAMAGNLT